MNSLNIINEYSRLIIANTLINYLSKAGAFKNTPKKEDYYLEDLLDLDNLVYNEEYQEYKNDTEIILKYRDEGYFIISNYGVRFEVDADVIDSTKVAGTVTVDKSITYEDLAKLPENTFEQIKSGLNTASEWINVQISKVGNGLQIMNQEGEKILIALKSNIDGFLAFIKEKLMHLAIAADVSIVFGFIVVFSFAFYIIFKKLVKAILSIFKIRRSKSKSESLVYEQNILSKVSTFLKKLGRLLKKLATIVINIIRGIFTNNKEAIQEAKENIDNLVQTQAEEIKEEITKQTQNGVDLEKREQQLKEVQVNISTMQEITEMQTTKPVIATTKQVLDTLKKTYQKYQETEKKSLMYYAAEVNRKIIEEISLVFASFYEQLKVILSKMKNKNDPEYKALRKKVEIYARYLEPVLRKEVEFIGDIGPYYILSKWLTKKRTELANKAGNNFELLKYGTIKILDELFERVRSIENQYKKVKAEKLFHGLRKFLKVVYKDILPVIKANENIATSIKTTFEDLIRKYKEIVTNLVRYSSPIKVMYINTDLLKLDQLMYEGAKSVIDKFDPQNPNYAILESIKYMNQFITKYNALIKKINKYTEQT